VPTTKRPATLPTRPKPTHRRITQMVSRMFRCREHRTAARSPHPLDVRTRTAPRAGQPHRPASA
jgi:hypothetical protein